MVNKKISIKPADIRTKEFSKKLFGYDPDEVEAFLNDVANAYQNLLNEIENLKKKTPEYKTEMLIEKAKREIEKIVQKKTEEKEQLERKKKELEIEIEKLKLAQKKVYDRLKLAILDMTRILEELRPNVKSEKEGKRVDSRSESPAKSVKKQDRESGRGKAESESNSSAGRGKGEQSGS